MKSLLTKLNLCLGLLASALLLDPSSSMASQDQVLVSGRQLMMVYGGVDRVHGNFIFLVSNRQDEALEAKVPVAMPENVVDFVPLEGVSAGEISTETSADGKSQIFIDKSFPPGDSIISLAFQIAAKGGESKIRVEPPLAIDSLTFLVDPALTVTAPAEYKTEKNVTFGQRRYNSYAIAEVEAGAVQSISISGVGIGRAAYWILGGGAGLALLLLAGILASRTRPRQMHGSY